MLRRVTVLLTKNTFLFKQSRALFCNKDPKDPKGFGNFDRKNKQNDKKPKEEQTERKKQEPKRQPKETKKQQPKKQQKKEEAKNNSQNNPNNDDDGDNQNNKSNFQKKFIQLYERLEKWWENLGGQQAKQYKEKVKNFKLNYYHLIWLGIALYFIPRRKKFTYSEFMRQLDDGKVTQIQVSNIQNPQFHLRQVYYNVDGQKGLVVIDNMEEVLNKVKANPRIVVKFKDSHKIINFFQRNESTISILILCASIFLISRSLGYMNNMGRGQGSTNNFNKKKFQMVKDVKTRFKDVAGLSSSKFQVQEFVDFLRNPQKYKNVGARIPKGALLTGPPGTGKTLLAKACAGEAGVPFFFASGSDFVEMYVGVGAARVRELFKQAKAMSPSIIFIDEIDAVGRKRKNDIGSNDERDGTLNQLLVEMDGFGTDTKVIVLAATNRKQMLDSALIRPGRFDRSIDITLPDLEGRTEIFHIHLTPIKLNPERTKEEYAKRLATLTPGFSGAQISNICNEAAILAARLGKTTVDSKDFEMATERVLGGVERKTLVTAEERKVVAVHESGHGVVSWFLKGAFPLLKLTIIPRSKGALGFAQYLPTEAKLQTKQELIDRICFILGGRCAEEHFFSRVTTGAYDDLQKAYQIAYTLVTKYGMSDKLINMSYQESDYLKNYSEQTGDVIDLQIKAIIDRCTRVTRQLVKKHHNEIKKLSQVLLQKQSIDGKQIINILGQRPFEHHSSYKAYLQMKKNDELPKSSEPAAEETVKEPQQEKKVEKPKSEQTM